MSTLIHPLKYTTKAEWIVSLSCMCLCLFLRIFNILPILVYDVVLFFFASVMTIYSTFYSKHKEKVSIKNRLIGAMFGGAFVWQLIEASSKLFAKWAVGMFY